MIYFLCVLGALSVFGGVLSGYLSLKNKMDARLVAKLIGSVLFVLVCVFAAFYKKKYSDYFILVVLALIFGMLGDIFLCMDKVGLDKHNLLFKGIGMLCFLIGHIFFISLFLHIAQFKWYLLPIIVILPIAMLIASKLSFVKAGKLLIPVLIYSIILGLMATSAISVFIDDRSTIGLLVLIAGLLFAVSDTSLCIRDWGNINKNTKRVLIFVVLSTYYIAQVMFAISIYYL